MFSRKQTLTLSWTNLSKVLSTHLDPVSVNPNLGLFLHSSTLNWMSEKNREEFYFLHFLAGVPLILRSPHLTVLLRSLSWSHRLQDKLNSLARHKSPSLLAFPGAPALLPRVSELLWVLFYHTWVSVHTASFALCELYTSLLLFPSSSGSSVLSSGAPNSRRQTQGFREPLLQWSEWS